MSELDGQPVAADPTACLRGTLEHESDGLASCVEVCWKILNEVITVIVLRSNRIDRPLTPCDTRLTKRSTT